MKWIKILLYLAIAGSILLIVLDTWYIQDYTPEQYFILIFGHLVIILICYVLLLLLTYLSSISFIPLPGGSSGVSGGSTEPV